MQERNKTRHHSRIFILFMSLLLVASVLICRIGYIMLIRGEYYTERAEQLHERERYIKAARGKIIDRNGVVIADNRAVCTISVIHSQIKEPEKVIEILSRELSLPEDKVRARVEKWSSIEKIKSNVEKEIGDRIRGYNLAGVKVDEDYKRYYPYNDIASKVLGFTGADNQGIIGLEVIYDEELQGTSGTILTLTDASGVEVENAAETRVEPVKGNDLQISIDMNIQEYATQLAEQAMANNEADRVSVIVMNPQNGEVYAMVDVPEFQLNSPYELNLAAYEEEPAGEDYQNALNAMWRNGCINDTYEPGSTFKIITTAAGLEEGIVTPGDSFHCPGYIMVEDRKIRCHKTVGHGSETFTQGIMNSCNPVFISVGLRLGVDRFVDYFQQFKLTEKTGIDLPGEAGTIMHRAENMGPVELATVSFGQSFQITPIQLITTVSMIINGGTRVTPHFGLRTLAEDGSVVKEFEYESVEGLVSEETSQTVRELLEKVVSEGTGRNGYVEGFTVGGKTATSQTLPRGSGKYIASFVGFAPAEDPQVIALVIIHNPKGVYYGGTIAAPVVRRLFENILPYLERMNYNEQRAE
ncbi:MAG: peptidoglycan glycosyltransferase [Lachnospiraceae bacterium]|nr:peptidoglycan glycosyltransferase [Lachnospiraceae bacterium]